MVTRSHQSPDRQSLPSMENSKSNHEQSPVMNGLVDFGATPPWYIGQVEQPESAMRSTLSQLYVKSAESSLGQSQRILRSTAPAPVQPADQFAALQNHINPVNLQKYPSRPLQFPMPISERTVPPPPRHPVHNNAFFGRHHEDLPAFTVDMNEAGVFDTSMDGSLVRRINGSLLFDKKDGRMYHMGHTRGETYSGTFTGDNPEDIPDQARRFIYEVAEKERKPIRAQEAAKLLKDTRKQLDTGGYLVLERTGFVEHGGPVCCCRPDCPYDEGIPQNHCYLRLAGATIVFTYCLVCFEMLWAGKLTPSFEEEINGRRDSGMDSRVDQLDGLSTPNLSDIYKSRPAVFGEELEDTLQPVRAPGTPSISPKEDITYDSPRSVNSRNEWVHPPTPFQHIASSIKLGGTLSVLDISTVVLWQVASIAQVRWEQHLRKVTYTRAYYAGLTEEDRGMNLPPVDTKGLNENVDEKPLEAKTGIRKKDCYGRDLSEVLKEVANAKR